MLNAVGARSPHGSIPYFQNPQLCGTNPQVDGREKIVRLTFDFARLWHASCSERGDGRIETAQARVPIRPKGGEGTRMDARDAQSAESRTISEPGDQADWLVDWLAGGSDIFLGALTVGPRAAGSQSPTEPDWPKRELPSADCRYVAAAVKRARAH